MEGNAYRFGSWTFDPVEQRLYREGSEVPLQPLTAHTLALLLQQAGKTVDREALIAEVWAGTLVSDAAIAQAIRKVRVALDDTATPHQWVLTVPRLGYRFQATDLRTTEAPSKRRLPAERGWWRRVPWPEAERHCASIGAELPTADDFLRLRQEHGYDHRAYRPHALPYLRIIQEWDGGFPMVTPGTFWTRSPGWDAPDDPNLRTVFVATDGNRRNGRVDVPEDVSAVRCVLRR